MMRLLAAFSTCAALCSGAVFAEPVGDSIDQHILPGFAAFSQSAEALHDAARQCPEDVSELRAVYHGAFDKWIAVSHLRFGPTEKDDRAFAIAFWPDTRGATAKALSKLARATALDFDDPTVFREASIAVRGFYALERLLFDPEDAPDAFECRLINAIALGMVDMSSEILGDWQDKYAELLLTAGEGNPTYHSHDEAVQELFKALVGGLEFSADVRIGRPLGSFEHPRPKRADARRSGRSLLHVQLALRSIEALGQIMTQDHPQIALHMDEAFARAIKVAAKLDDPVFAGVADATGRLKVEIQQIEIRRILEVVINELGPTLGVNTGFNALDGD